MRKYSALNSRYCYSLKVFRAGIYFMLSGTWHVGDDTQNGRYPSVKPETFRDYFRRNNALTLEEDTTGFRALIRGPAFR